MEKMYEVDALTGCWVWKRGLSPNGYGHIRLGTHLWTAHRLIYSIWFNEILNRKDDVCHTCDNRKCINPAHLFKGSRSDNMRDCFVKGRKPTKLSPDNISTIIDRVNSGEPRYRVAKDFGVSATLIGQIVSGKAWKYAHLRNESHSPLRS